MRPDIQTLIDKSRNNVEVSNDMELFDKGIDYSKLSVEETKKLFVYSAKLLHEALKQKEPLSKALSDPKWLSHKRGDKYTMDNKPELWTITYYPVLEDNKGNKYNEPRAIVERPIVGGFDIREIPLRYLNKQ